MVATSAPVRAYLTAPRVLESETFYALMVARRQEKKVLGAALQGKLIATSVPQTLLQFSNQTLVLPAADAETARAALAEAGLESLLSTFAEHLAHARDEYKALKTEREMARVFPAAPASGPGFPPRRIAALDERLRARFDALHPEAIIDELARFLLNPGDALNVTPVEYHVTRGGVIENAPADDTQHIAFMELHSRDRRSHAVLPVFVRRDEAREALAQARTERDNLLLI